MSLEKSGAEKVPGRKLKPETELNVAQYLSRNLPMPFSEALERSLMVCGANSRALPAHHRALARAFARYCQEENLEGFITGDQKTESGL